jgi:hypothetical protein
MLPNRQPSRAEGLTYYQNFTGPGTPFTPPRHRVLTFDDFTDGLANTLLVVEAAEAVPWTRPGGLPFYPEGRLPVPGRHYRSDHCNALFVRRRLRADPLAAGRQFRREIAGRGHLRRRRETPVRLTRIAPAARPRGDSLT